MDNTVNNAVDNAPAVSEVSSEATNQNTDTFAAPVQTHEDFIQQLRSGTTYDQARADLVVPYKE